MEKKSKDDGINRIFEKARACLDAMILIQEVYNFFTEHNDLVLSIEDVLNTVISPFYAITPLENDTIERSIAKCICEYWVLREKLSRTKINDEVFYFCG